MRVGFDGRDLLRRHTGVANYARYLATHLVEQEGLDLILYEDSFQDPAVLPPNLPQRRRLNAPPVLWKHLALPWALSRDRAQLFHSPSGTLPLVAPCPLVVTIHDLFADIEPRWFSTAMGRQLRLAQRRAAQEADAVCVVSSRTRQDVLERYGLPEQKVHVTPNGVDHARFRPPAGPEDVERAQRACDRLGVRRPFVLCVGSLLPWRNAPTLLRAVAAWRAAGAEHQLLFVGRDVWGTDPTQRLARENNWDTWARFAGYVADADLPALYWAADIVAAPSLYEGFGLPALEALACATPVVAARRGALPEVLGDAALFVAPLDSSALAAALRDVARDSGLRQHLRALGVARAALFDWQQTAVTTKHVYEAVVQDARRTRRVL